MPRCTVIRLAATAAATAVAVPAVSAQAATLHHPIAHRKERHNAPLTPARRTAPAAIRTSTARHLTLTGPKLRVACTGAGPLARPAQFISYRTQPSKRFSPPAKCIGIIED